MYTCPSPHRDKRRSSRLQPYTPDDNLNNALGAIRVLGLELIADELKPHLNTVLTNIKERKGAAEQVVISGILPILAQSLRNTGPLTLLTAKLVAELAKESVVCKGFGDAGLATALLSVLTSPDQELLLHAARAISRMSYDSSKLQDLLLRRGAVPRLVAILLRFPDKEALEEVCLQALCNLSGMGVAEEAGMVWERGASVRPGESVFHGVSPHTCGFASSVTLVCVSQWAPGQYAVNIEVFQRCSSSFWSLHGNKRTARWFPFSRLGNCSNLYKVIKFSTRSVPRTKSLKTRVFHTFL
ncbi:LOW QUALITY PROTEIN: rap1 GTPase-GDP dissociation stimulator 1-like [Cottoperca gobio]|uniref:LOW QUALITY PROTEIN: rap1 GTPase-GDP dissociation stimulator 1-like n=1 Tax=Cottoperca gobio TaxID=56716 RepID=A0A6J2RPN6_COTGO|nr:LOW QUALITY PROTEIN: rap1 GTPase-GDP dissociation stimulator 1-like [Cottoperca gobio]